ncbi:uncharacterized protein LOC107885091 [Acyrthosiphon pisum]|uniref:DUF4806 domain-containing protein n=1 Tax=Acyrthosiphon pisum TaxID=7029 RepID=A0A8R2D7J2_ACYPI|nr:uncharacterized protein LOC107885091 [Acyrthosiphon pisum]
MVNELKELSKNGLITDFGKKRVVVSGFCCDAPARSFILKTKGHTGFFSCSRCTIEGVYLENRGVMKKLILLWLGSIKKAPLSVRLETIKVLTISNNLLLLKPFITSDFSRLPRGLNEVPRWKATEYRLFLLYSGPIVLQGMLNEDCYSHFICLHICFRILLTSNVESELIHFCEKLLIYFVDKFGKLYGKHFISHNVHGLLHIVDDYAQYGALDNCSCFPFENFLQFLKKMVRKFEKPLEQVIKRYNEYLTFSEFKDSTCKKDIDFRKPHNEGPIIDQFNGSQFKCIIIDDFKIDTQSIANCYVGFTKENQLHISSLSEAKSKASIAMYRSDFTDDDDNISNLKKQNSPARSNASMPLFSDSDNENESLMMVSKKPFISMKCVSAGSIKNHTKKRQNGWSPSPKKFKSIKTHVDEEQDVAILPSPKPSTSTSHAEKSSTARKLSFTHDVSDVFDFKKTKNLPIHSTIERRNDIKEQDPVALYHNKSNTPISISNVVPADQSLETKDTAASVSSKASTVSHDTIFQNNMMRNMAFLKVEMRQIQSNQSVMFEHFESILTHLQGNNTYTDKKSLSQNDFHDCPLPLDNNIDLNTIEDKIAGDHQFKSRLINELSYIGGKNCKAMVKRLMSKLFTDDLLSDYSYTGKKGKKPFSTLFICSVIFDAIKKQVKFSNIPKNEIEETIKQVLAQAPFNIKRKMDKKTCANSTT